MCVFLSVLIKTAPRNPEEIAEYVPLNLLHPIHITIADLRQIFFNPKIIKTPNRRVFRYGFVSFEEKNRLDRFNNSEI